LSPLAGVRVAWRDARAVLDLHAQMALGGLLLELAVGLVLAVGLYVPIHELLHALGCLVVGGEVTRIEIAPLFGGSILARVFPVVSAETEYAGRLSGFDVGGSTWRLLATDVAPYLLTVSAGVPLVRRLQRCRCAWLVPAALPLALAPWISLTGDYYEMGSALVTAALALAGSDWSALRSDDLVALCARLWATPEAAGVTTVAQVLAAVAIVAASFVLGAVLAGATYLLGTFFAPATSITAAASTARASIWSSTRSGGRDAAARSEGREGVTAKDHRG
jgi:hypothetical protein